MTCRYNLTNACTVKPRNQERQTQKALQKFSGGYKNRTQTGKMGIYLSDILQTGFEEGNIKSFWKYVRSQRQDNLGVTALKKEDQLHSDRQTKCNVLAGQVFHRDWEYPNQGTKLDPTPRLTTLSPTEVLKNPSALIKRRDWTRYPGGD